MFNTHDISRNACQLFGAQAHQGYDWWWHSFTGHDALTGEEKLRIRGILLKSHRGASH